MSSRGAFRVEHHNPVRSFKLAMRRTMPTQLLNALLPCALAVAGVLGVACEKKVEPEPTDVAASAEVKAEPTSAATAQEKAAEPEAEEAVSAAPTASASAPAAESSAAAKAPPGDAPKTEKPAPPAYSGPNPCKATSFKFASVRSACNRGGVPEAKSMMKGIVKKAKDKGEDIKCSSCHDDTKTYTLKPNAVADMRKLQ